MTASGIRSDVTQFITNYGQSVRFRYFTPTFITGSYDDQVTWAQSGTDTWVSGQVQPFDATRSTQDAILLQQGLARVGDVKLYVAGTVQSSGTFSVGIGSGATVSAVYAAVENGIVEGPLIGEGVAYKKITLRPMTGSTFYGG